MSYIPPNLALGYRCIPWSYFYAKIRVIWDELGRFNSISFGETLVCFLCVAYNYNVLFYYEL